MKHSIRTVCNTLACASACLLAMPGQAQNFPQHKFHTVAQEKADAAAAKAREAAAAHEAAQKAAAAMRAGIKTPEAKARGAMFTPAVVKPYLNTLNAILADSKKVTTPAQATTFLAKLHPALPKFEQRHKQILQGYADFENSGEKTPDNLAAEKMLGESGIQAEAIDNEFARIEKFYPAAKPDFQKFRDIYN